MSGLSASLTFLLSHADAATFVNAVGTKNWSAVLPEYGKEDEFLYASSRNNYMEYALRAVLKEFQCEGLSYLRRWDEIINRPPWAVALEDASLDRAVQDQRRLIRLMQDNPAKSAALIYGAPDSVLEREVAEAAAMSVPDSFGEAYRRYQQLRHKSDGGDDAWALISFLHAHTQLLGMARARNMAAVYALWLY